MRRVITSVWAGFALLAAVRPAAAQPTFNRDAAPILFAHCASCHHPDGPAPFSVLSYASARQHARQIADVTGRRYMPPWKADPGSGEFIGQHRLTDAQIDLLRRWAEGGALEGAAADRPAPPAITAGWQLGTPDLVVSLPRYTVEASGTDVFRIFVVPIPTTDLRFVRGIEFRPGSTSVVHHANIRVDRTTTSRRLDAADPQPGYEGLLAHSAMYPDGHFLAWTPGQAAPLLPKGLSWRLDRGTDLVIELHLQPTGKRETIEPAIGFYFTPDPPERTPGMIRLGRQSIDIAPGDGHYVLRDSFVLPVDVRVLAVQPHAHYRARMVRGTATLPDGSTRPLITIGDWDFRWQQVYRYVTPLALPRGTAVAMEYIYDNSANNPRNITQPPARVVWGQRSGDEMGDFWIQVLTQNDADLDRLLAAFHPKAVAEDVIGYEARIRAEPDSVPLHDDVALLYLDQGNVDKAVAHFARSAALAPTSAAAHYNLATSLTLAGRLDEAIASYNEALRLRPDYAVAHNNLGALLLQRQQLATARLHLAEAVRLEPGNADALANLGRLERRSGRPAEARARFEQALAARPDWPPALTELAAQLLDGGTGDVARARQLGEQAVVLTGRQDARALDVLAAVYARSGDFARAAATAQEALGRASDGPSADEIRARVEQYRAGRTAGIP